MSTKSQSYIALVKQKISRENRDKWPTPEDVTDYRVHKMLGISQPSMSHFANGRPFDDETCLKVARFLGIPEALVLFEIWQDRPKSDDVKKVIKGAAKVIKADFKNKVKALIVPILGTLLIGGIPEKSAAYTAPIIDNTIHYAKLIRFAWGRLRRLFTFARGRRPLFAAA